MSVARLATCVSHHTVNSRSTTRVLAAGRHPNRMRIPQSQTLSQAGPRPGPRATSHDCQQLLQSQSTYSGQHNAYGICSMSSRMFGTAVHLRKPRLPSAPRILDSIDAMRMYRKDIATNMNQTIGLVPTMGALHDGHISLIQHAQQHCDTVVATVFVNPKQFGPNEDFDRYPRQLEADIAKLAAVGCDAVFAPPPTDMYPSDVPQGVFVDIDDIDTMSEGKSRPGFFRGVATVVSKLLNICQPDHAFFGQKDGLQSIVIQRLVRELNFPVQVTICPTRREHDGLAMSSRNVYLSHRERTAAPVVYRAIQAAATACETADVLPDFIRHAAQAVLQSEPAIEAIEYVSVANMLTGEELTNESMTDTHGQVLISIAVRMGDTKTRLLDNCIVDRRP
jgi:pantoate--beta-alanine ligase